VRATVVVSVTVPFSAIAWDGSSSALLSDADGARTVSNCEYNGNGVGQPAGYWNSESSSGRVICVVNAGVFPGGYEISMDFVAAGIGGGIPDWVAGS
jgi:hypothetical protein